MSDFDDAVRKELYFESQRVSGLSSKGFGSILRWIVGAVSDGESLSDIKNYVKDQNINKDLKEKIYETMMVQRSVILGESLAFSLKKESSGGLTFAEALKDREEANKGRAINFIPTARDLLKTGGIEGAITIEKRKYTDMMDTFISGQLKSAREYAYVDKDKETDHINGWLSVAILDNRTSPICAGYHNKFYRIDEFKERTNIPNIPPRHPRCRSILMTTRASTNINDYKGENIDTFMKRNPDITKDFMGQKKYEMWKSGENKVKSYIDLKGARFFTNAEIIKKFKIG